MHCRVRMINVVVLHHLILSETVVLHAHVATAHLVGVLDVAQAERATTVLVSSELGDGGICVVSVFEFDDAGTLRATVAFVGDLSLLDSTDSCEEIDEILVGCGPWELPLVSLRIGKCG